MGRNIRKIHHKAKKSSFISGLGRNHLNEQKSIQMKQKIQTQDIFDDCPSLINVFPLLVSFYSIWSAVVFWSSSRIYQLLFMVQSRFEGF